MKKRALSLLMSLVMLVSMLPTTAWAADTTETTNKVEIAIKDCKEIGTYKSDVDADGSAYLFDGEIDEGATAVSFVDFQNAGWVSVANTLGDDPKETYTADITQDYVMDTTSESWHFNDAYSEYDFSDCNAYWIMDENGVNYYVVVQLPKGTDFTATIGNGEPLTYTLVKGGYSYTAYGSDTPTIVDLYKVQIPVGTTTVDLAYKTGHLTYNYRGVGETPVSVTDNDWLYGWYEGDSVTSGDTTATVPVDYAPDGGESDGLIDYIQVQNPYGGSTYGELLYAITFEYAAPFTATSDGSPLNITELNETGYNYSYGWPVVTADGPLYTVTVPKTAKSVDLSFPKKQIVYNYDGNGGYLCDYSNVDWQTGTEELDGVLLDSNGDGKLDYAQIQNPYADNGASGGEFVCAIKFTYPDGTTGTPSPVTPSGEVSFTDLINGIASAYAANGAGSDSNTPWIAADMAAFAKTYPGSSNYFTSAEKQNIVDYRIDSASSDKVSPSELAKSIIALTAMGYDSTKLTTSSKETLDAVAKLAAMVNDETNTSVTYIYTLPFVMIALQEFGDVYSAELEKLASSAVSQALENGGWGYVYQGTENFDVDATSFVLQALAPYYNVDGSESVTAAINSAKGALYRNLTFSEKGAVIAYGNPSAESTAQLIVALTALGMDAKDSMFRKDLSAGLMSLAATSADGFMHGGQPDKMSTEQGFRGLIALANAKEGQPYRLYDFSGQNLVPAVATQAGINFAVIPNDAKVVVTDSENHEVAAVSAYRYDLPAGIYTYTVSKDGYVTKTGSFTITAEQVAGHEKQTIHVSLVSAGSGSGSSSKDIKVTVKVMVPPADQSKRYTYKHDSRSYTNLLTTTGKVTVTAGSSVRDAFVTALDRDKIGYTEQSNGYFPTIGSWSEFERGEKSGWMYLVNGSMPSVAAQDYELTGNATVVWFYTDDYSNDYGSESWDDDSSSSGTTTTPTTPTTPANPVPDKAMSFTDVKSNDWYYSSVRYAYDNGLFSGVSHESFGPGDSMDRSMLATVLYSLDGKPAAGKSGFADVADGAWYADAVAWAAEHGIVSGVGGGAFTPGGTITREQLAVMLYRYAQYKGYDVSKTADLSGYADQDKLSDWAAQAVQWACGSGLMNGRSAAQLAPEGTLTRAEAATMLKAFCENVKK